MKTLIFTTGDMTEAANKNLEHLVQVHCVIHRASGDDWDVDNQIITQSKIRWVVRHSYGKYHFSVEEGQSDLYTDYQTRRETPTTRTNHSDGLA